MTFVSVELKDNRKTHMGSDESNHERSTDTGYLGVRLSVSRDYSCVGGSNTDDARVISWYESGSQRQSQAEQHHNQSSICSDTNEEQTDGATEGS